VIISWTTETDLKFSCNFGNNFHLQKQILVHQILAKTPAHAKKWMEWQPVNVLPSSKATSVKVSKERSQFQKLTKTKWCSFCCLLWKEMITWGNRLWSLAWSSNCIRIFSTMQGHYLWTDFVLDCTCNICDNFTYGNIYKISSCSFL